MAEKAELAPDSTLPEATQLSSPRRQGNWADTRNAPATRQQQLTDLSVGPDEERELEHSHHRARIVIQLPRRSPTTYLRFLESHLQGRGAFLTIEHGDVLDVLYSVHDNTAESVAEVGRFACEVLLLLRLPESALLMATVKTMDNNRLRRILTAAGVERPELRLV